ncbi:MAG: hypothetical protein CFE24_03770 [Flavobacterium sp. BFFFF2]|nr:MAG: hypothetical protein CFE24_03770 [Flavobacterium sp. BFFFF2]
MFFSNPDIHLLPDYRISPFKTDFVGRNLHLPETTFLTSYCDQRFGAGNWLLTQNGRSAISAALTYYHLKSTDVVTILTTTENFYISGCVTKTIDLFCRWNRTIVPETKLLFINHEFGYPHPEMAALSQLGIPIIEDSCTTFFSQDEAGKLGTYGDFTVYSFPKFFPIQIGGILVKNQTDFSFENVQTISEESATYMHKVVGHELAQAPYLLANRAKAFDAMQEQMKTLGFVPRIAAKEGTVPSVFLFSNQGIVQDLPDLKDYLYRQGIQCSVFYGDDAFFIPCHQHLSLDDVAYIVFQISQFIANQ